MAHRTPEVPQDLPRTLGALRRSGVHGILPVKEEMRRNLIARLRAGQTVFPGIVGYDRTVIPQVQAAVLARHDFLLLGLRGQAKTRLIRQLIHLLDEWTPTIDGSPINESPFEPLTKMGRELARTLGDELPIGWLHRSQRYHEKLATPDVSIADLIGDIDPIKAVSRKLDFSDEEVIHYGLIPRSNRGIFAINELPDLQARIQVGLLNIMEEKDIQIRGFPVRLPLDLALVFTANPEDYTNRGNIITPLKDRINAQILTHYPETIDAARRITAQESWTDRGAEIHVPELLAELVEEIAFEARRSDFVDKASGVSARMSISLLETLYSLAELRAHRYGEEAIARIGDLYEATPALTGKIELVHKGEQEGIVNVAFHLVGKALKNRFAAQFADAMAPGEAPAGKKRRKAERESDFKAFQPIIDWFEAGNVLELNSQQSQADHERALLAVGGLEAVANALANPKTHRERITAMEFIIEGMHQHFLLTKQISDARIRYSDAVSYMMGEAES